MNQSSRLGFAVFGFGRAGVIHAENIIRNPQAILKWIVELDVEKAQQFVASNLLDTKVVPPSAIDQVLSDPSVHAVVITTPTPLHEELVLSCVKNSKAVFCEKPIATTVEAVERCYNEAANHNVALLCGFNRRFDPAIRSVANQVTNGGIGKVHVIKTTSRDGTAVPVASQLASTGGIFHDSCVHDVDMICWIMGEAPGSVFCMAHAFNDGIAQLPDVDTIAVVMKFSSGAIGQIDLSRHGVYGYDQRLEVFGASGMLTSDNTTSLSSTLYSDGGITKKPYQVSFPQRYAKAYEQELCHFINVLRKKEVLLVTKDDVLRSWHVVDAIEKSFHNGKQVTLDKGVCNNEH